MLDFARGATDVDNAIQLANMLDTINSSVAKAVFDNIVSMATGQGVTSVLKRSGQYPAGPSFYYADSGGYGLLLIGHTVSSGQANDVYNGYVAGILRNGPTIENTYLATITTLIKAEIERALTPLAGNILIAGHSIGGVIGEYYAKTLISLGFPAQPVRVSFGSPKSGGVDTFGTLGTGFAVRWMCDDDPVPLIPPNTFPALNLFGLNNPIFMRNAGNFIHASGGLSLNNQGQATPAILPPLASFWPSIDIGAWILATEVGQGTSHSLAEYSRRLILFKALLDAPGHTRPTPSPAERPNPPRPVEVNRAADAAVNAIFAVGGVQNAQPVDIPGGGPFFAFRSGRVWQVAFGSAIIAIGPTKRKARAIANRANDWLHHLQQSGVVDPEGILNQLRDYLIEASDPTGGFRPVMQTNIPRFELRPNP